MGTTGQNVVKIRMLYRNIIPLTGNGKYICKGNHIFMLNCPNTKELQKFGTLEICIMRKTRKISVPCFQSEFVVGKKKRNIFTMIQFLLLPFLKKLVRSPTFLLSTHTQSNTESSQHICVLHHGQ
jgi:hypothetical protein